jgi:hypothetical protein
VKKLSLLVCLAACNGTETGNPPVIDFGNSGCRTKLYDVDKGIYPQSLDVGDDPLHEGLTCITFERSTALDYRFQVTNYESGCGADEGWKPAVELREDGVDLILQDSDCITASCLWCVYDLSFTVQFDQPPADGTVHLYQRGCSDEQRRPKSAFLPVRSQNSGAACNYQHSVALRERNLDVGGPRTMCEVVEGFGVPECRAGLSCHDLGDRAPGDFSGGQRCLATCQADRDCDSLSQCMDGVCQLEATGLSSN